MNQGKRKEQIEFSELMASIGIIGFVTILLIGFVISLI